MDYTPLTKPDLENLAEARGLEITGSRSTLIERLRAYDREQAREEVTNPAQPLVSVDANRTNEELRPPEEPPTTQHATTAAEAERAAEILRAAEDDSTAAEDPEAVEAIRRAQALADAETTARARAEAAVEAAKAADAAAAALASLRGNSPSIRTHLHVNKTEHEPTHIRSDSSRVVTSEKPQVHAHSEYVRGSRSEPRLQPGLSRPSSRTSSPYRCSRGDDVPWRCSVYFLH